MAYLKDTIPHTHLGHPRTRKAVAEEYRKFWDKVWYARHVTMPEPANEFWQQGEDMARALEDRYGKEFLDPGSDIDQLITLGKFKALDWVLGCDWVGSGDT